MYVLYATANDQSFLADYAGIVHWSVLNLLNSTFIRAARTILKSSGADEARDTRGPICCRWENFTILGNPVATKGGFRTILKGAVYEVSTHRPSIID